MKVFGIPLHYYYSILENMCDSRLSILLHMYVVSFLYMSINTLLIIKFQTEMFDTTRIPIPKNKTLTIQISMFIAKLISLELYNIPNQFVIQNMQN